jgi:hypothetical protein
MSSVRISSLPLKTTVDIADIVPLVDTQYGAENYISKRTTVGDILNLAQTYFVAKIDFEGIVSTINGKSGNVVLSLPDLADITFSSPTNADLLAYDSSAERWVNKSLENEVLDCGTF